ncbi:ribonuclease T2 family protein [Legionella bononiensis]|uniref:Ribonuclease T n=1 Tax=Legionella bononiensis TaxID=2793102 RepID=A0ABS1WG28_9GAMM|nr:ribonuclease T [Legionella bononiensis]MBL7481742.1 ribonuclease T [Legionella bononiensis]MBL7528290.1 ribonuclease T [Legionella bononiensis]MBL7562765.1 ribonuclease T [Legionella bononiensis]
MIKFITLLFLAFSVNVNALNAVSGTFEATKSCPAYLSKNKKTNPDNLMVQIHQQYQLKEINKSPPDWLRIVMPESHNSLRWVSADCGLTEYTERNSEKCDSRAGMADSHVLALSSQPGFCQTYGYEAGKPECRKLTGTSYQANHLTLHGLWPNQENCGQRYGFCDVKPRSNHCDYSPLNLSSQVGEQLKILMPSYKYGSCLERHEWNKHGSCQVLTPDNYFSLAMRLVSEVDDSVFGRFLTDHKGKTVKLSLLREHISQAFGSNNAGKIYLGCKDGYLVDVFIQLPALIPFNESVASLINKAPDNQYHDSCSSNVTISDFSKESWY